MQNPITLLNDSLTIDEHDAALLKRVALIDDVISTGGSLAALEQLVTQVGATVIARATVLIEDYATTRENIIYLEKRPVFDTL